MKLVKTKLSSAFSYFLLLVFNNSFQYTSLKNIILYLFHLATGKVLRSYQTTGKKYRILYFNSSLFKIEAITDTEYNGSKFSQNFMSFYHLFMVNTSISVFNAYFKCLQFNWSCFLSFYVGILCSVLSTIRKHTRTLPQLRHSRLTAILEPVSPATGRCSAHAYEPTHVRLVFVGLLRSCLQQYIYVCHRIYIYIAVDAQL